MRADARDMSPSQLRLLASEIRTTAREAEELEKLAREKEDSVPVTIPIKNKYGEVVPHATTIGAVKELDPFNELRTDELIKRLIEKGSVKEIEYDSKGRVKEIEFSYSDETDDKAKDKAKSGKKGFGQKLKNFYGV